MSKARESTSMLTRIAMTANALDVPAWALGHTYAYPPKFVSKYHALFRVRMKLWGTVQHTLAIVETEQRAAYFADLLYLIFIPKEHRDPRYKGNLNLEKMTPSLLDDRTLAYVTGLREELTKLGALTPPFMKPAENIVKGSDNAELLGALNRRIDELEKELASVRRMVDPVIHITDRRLHIPNPTPVPASVVCERGITTLPDPQLVAVPPPSSTVTAPELFGGSC